MKKLIERVNEGYGATSRMSKLYDNGDDPEDIKDWFIEIDSEYKNGFIVSSEEEIERVNTGDIYDSMMEVFDDYVEDNCDRDAFGIYVTQLGKIYISLNNFNSGSNVYVSALSRTGKQVVDKYLNGEISDIEDINDENNFVEIDQ